MPTATKNELTLPPQDVCAIIEACGKADVQVLRFGNLYLRRGPAAKKVLPGYPLLPPDASLLSMGPDHARQNAETLDRDEDELRSEQLRMLMLENPVKYEQMLQDGELSEESEPDGDDA